MIVGRDEGDFGKGRGIVERGYGGATGPVVFVFWVGFFFFYIYCKIVIRGITLTFFFQK